MIKNIIKKKEKSNIKKEIWSNFEGLSEEIVKKKIKEKKNNKNIIDNNKTIKDIIFSNVFTFFNLLLFFMTIIILNTHHYEQLFFLFINALNLIINITQEIKAKITLDKISLITHTNSKVIREKKLISISSENIIKNDIIFLDNNEQIIVDAKILKGFLTVDESLLTGESKPIIKKKGDFLYSGSYVIDGQACAQVKAVAKNMYISKLSKTAKKYKKIKTPLTQNFSFLVLFITFLLVPIALLLSFSFKKISNDNFILSLCGFMLGTMPSGLFLLTNVTLAIGFVKLAKKKAYIKDLFGIEMLAQIDILCLDKTGTITDGKMEVKEILNYPNYPMNKQLLSDIINSFSNNNATQNALKEKFYIKEKNIKNNNKIIKVQNFSSLLKYSMVEFDKLGTFVLGAPDFILKKNFYIIENDVNNKTKKGFRVLLLAQTDEKINKINKNTNYKLISLIMLEDVIKKDAPQTIKFFKQNNIKIKIISGDNPETINFILNRIGINDSKQKVINLANLSEEEIKKISIKNDFFGRATPEQKKIIINEIKKNNHKVAMIGDGINDILAFKESDLSIAMASGNKTVQNVANLILIDSKFHSLTKVITEGKRVINNLTKLSVLFLVKTISSFVLASITIINNTFSKIILTYPFNPLQMNLIDTFFIGIPSFFLALEPSEKKIKTNFLKIIFKNSLPFAIMIGFNYFYLLNFIFEKNFIQEQISIILHFITAIIFLFLLIKSSMPLKKFKLFLIILMLLGFVIFDYFLLLNKTDLVSLKQNLIQNYSSYIKISIINIIFLFFVTKKFNIKK
ncbi:HAD-IC family P-type ATPase [Texas Phoenix palm phytoplasma]|uniref:HAD-IC family P-type ATPase n=1 Tax=Texas Phoenix palm phytoplasma TaxID=176709 RepID=A0ABS5BJE2_9MOLU|nr:HAD-IC family P-type ATPase [Texas Phoenix palm phytoplasma]MBP3059314.1 HAD-IC family P-type ATPase [Texas Phoenix palm phytoplasma]